MKFYVFLIMFTYQLCFSALCEYTPVDFKRKGASISCYINHVEREQFCERILSKAIKVDDMTFFCENTFDCFDVYRSDNYIAFYLQFPKKNKTSNEQIQIHCQDQSDCSVHYFDEYGIFSDYPRVQFVLTTNEVWQNLKSLVMFKPRHKAENFYEIKFK